MFRGIDCEARSSWSRACRIDAFQALGHFVRPSHVPDRNPVNIELLMPKLHCFSDYDNDHGHCSAFDRYSDDHTARQSEEAPR
jgi:hypothetical protein